MKIRFILGILLLANLSEAQGIYRIGKNTDTIAVDGDSREFIVQVPRNYTAGAALPLVFMLHGTSGDGNRFHLMSGWKELGDSLDIITVFPSSWRYCLVEDQVSGNTSVTTRWNDFSLTLCPNVRQRKRDDIKFLDMLMDKLNRELRVDTNKVYIVGFSNGGAMAGRCAIELSHRVAAVVEDAGTLPFDTLLTPRRMLPVAFMIGNKDSRWLRHESFTSLPMDLEIAKDSFPPLELLTRTHINSFRLDSNFTSTSSLGGRIITEQFNSLDGNNNCYFRFVYVQGLDHNYPNTKNHWLPGALTHWVWLRNFSLH